MDTNLFDYYQNVDSEMQWRLVIVCGALPAIALMMLSIQSLLCKSGRDDVEARYAFGTADEGIVATVLAEWRVIRQSRDLSLNIFGVVLSSFFSDFVLCKLVVN